MFAQVADISCAWADIGCPASRTGIPGAGPDIIIRHQYADMNVGQAQIISKNIPGAGRLPPCGSRHGQAGIPTPAPCQVAGLDVPVQGSKDKHYRPSLGHVRAGARLWQGRRRCAAVLSPPGRCVPSSGLSGGASGVVSPDMPVRRRCRLHVGRHILCRAAWQELCSLVYLGPSVYNARDNCQYHLAISNEDRTCVQHFG